MQVIVLVPNLAFVLHNDSILYITTFAASVETVWACSKLFCRVNKGREYYVIDHTLREQIIVLYITTCRRRLANPGPWPAPRPPCPRWKSRSSLGCARRRRRRSHGGDRQVRADHVPAAGERRPGWHNVVYRPMIGSNTTNQQQARDEETKPEVRFRLN
jgi:hypothetical protein